MAERLALGEDLRRKAERIRKTLGSDADTSDEDAGSDAAAADAEEDLELDPFDEFARIDKMTADDDEEVRHRPGWI